MQICRGGFSSRSVCLYRPGVPILVKKWSQRQNAGIKLNDSNPAAVENWCPSFRVYSSESSRTRDLAGSRRGQSESSTDCRDLQIFTARPGALLFAAEGLRPINDQSTCDQ